MVDDKFGAMANLAIRRYGEVVAPAAQLLVVSEEAGEVIQAGRAFLGLSRKPAGLVDDLDRMIEEMADTHIANLITLEVFRRVPHVPWDSDVTAVNLLGQAVRSKIATIGLRGGL